MTITENKLKNLSNEDLMQLAVMAKKQLATNLEVPKPGHVEEYKLREFIVKESLSKIYPDLVITKAYKPWDGYTSHVDLKEIKTCYFDNYNWIIHHDDMKIDKGWIFAYFDRATGWLKYLYIVETKEQINKLYSHMSKRILGGKKTNIKKSIGISEEDLLKWFANDPLICVDKNGNPFNK